MLIIIKQNLILS